MHARRPKLSSGFVPAEFLTPSVEVQQMLSLPSLYFIGSGSVGDVTSVVSMSDVITSIGSGAEGIVTSRMVTSGVGAAAVHGDAPDGCAVSALGRISSFA